MAAKQCLDSLLIPQCSRFLFSNVNSLLLVYLVSLNLVEQSRNTTTPSNWFLVQTYFIIGHCVNKYTIQIMKLYFDWGW